MTQPASRQQTGQYQQPDGNPGTGRWWLAEETPVALVYNDRPHGVMMASPGDLEDFALGFAIGEQVLTHRDGFVMTRLEKRDNGLILCSVLDEDYAGPGFDRRRSLEGRSGCGICGTESLDGLSRNLSSLPPVSPITPPDSATLNQAFTAMAAGQIVNRQNRSVHAAAFCDLDAKVLLLREDVGRHNALDKLVGACLKAGFQPGNGFILMTSRCSFELVQKAACAGFSFLASLGAPTAMARDIAMQTGLGLAARAVDNGFMYFDPAPDDKHPVPSHSSE